MKGFIFSRTYRKRFIVLCCALCTFFYSVAQNPIVLENQETGSPSTEWDVVGSGDPSIQGFATSISVNKGQTVEFKINTNSDDYSITIYRLGYYNGAGARNVGSGVLDVALPQVQPPIFQDLATGLVDCGTWNVSAHWDVPITAVSGIYIARIKRADTNGASHIIFIVRDDARNSDMLFQTSDATWQAYNVYGGNSLYVGATSFPAGHAAKVSYNRPFVTRAGGGGGGAGEDWVFNAEYPMIRFLERNGYDVSYITNVDVARQGSLLLNHKAFLSVGHDEYWSAEQRTNVVAAKAAGVHLAFFSGNEVYWKTRWETSYDGNNTPYRTLVCYKEGTLGEAVCNDKCDPTPTWTGLWRGGPGTDGNQPENGLTGQISWAEGSNSIQVPAAYKALRFWRGTSVANLGIEDVITFPVGTLGYEWDFEQYEAFNPPGRITMSSTTIDGKTHKLSLYRDPTSGALVFGAGTVQWSWGLDEVHDNGNLPVNQDMQQATINLFADMGIQPENLQAPLTAASQSTDTQKPITIITTPLNGSSVPATVPVTIAGTASDNAVIAGVEISLDGGTTWQVVTGGAHWQYTWTPITLGTVVIKVRGFDDSGNIENAGTAPAANAITVTVTSAPVANCPCSLFEVTDAPEITNLSDNNTGIEVGLKFRANASGFITGIRFYKGTSDNGAHTGSLWTLDGNLLGRATFSAESASGWQEVTLGAPVAVTEGMSYVVSTHTTSGFYNKTEPFFAAEFTNGPLTGLASGGASGANGVFNYSSVPAFPTASFQSDNYWVDVVFNTVSGTDVIAPVIISTTPVHQGTNFNVVNPIHTRFNEPIDQATVDNTTLELRDASNSLVAGTTSYNVGLRRVTFTPSAPLNYSSYYSFTVKGGASGIKDVAGNPLAADSTRTFSTIDPPAGSPNDGSGGPILIVSSTTNPFSRFATEILRAEGMNSFNAVDIATVNETMLADYDVVILGEMPLSPAQATMFTNWTTAGGTFIAFRPDSDLATLLGITPTGGTLDNQYLLANTLTAEGAGIVHETIQFHGTADLYTLSGASVLATLYTNASTASANPAVTTHVVGAAGGKAIAFTYDLAKSIVYTRQGNPAWAGQKRDGQTGPIRSDDLFFGQTEPDWIDFNKVAIPQADEQQHLLGNIILKNALHRKPLPKFWFLPRKLKAAIVMTGDDHANDGTTGRFNHYLTLGPNTPTDVADWKAIRGTSYLYNGTPITNTEAVAFENKGFEIALHPTTSCMDWTPASLSTTISTQLGTLATQLPGISAPVTNRMHCMTWSDWVSQAKVQSQLGLRLDVNYYYWPASWIQNRPGMFTGSGMPIRFADLDGTLVDCYQVPTQMTDESGIAYSSFVTSLLDKAIGPEGYYGVFCANMHTDSANHVGSETIIAAAIARQIPVISARQMLNWLDGRNNSKFTAINWAGNQLSFTVDALINARNLQGMVPLQSEDGQLSSITRNGNAISYTTDNIKGIQYAFFEATSGNYVATYNVVPLSNLTGTVSLQGRPAAPNPRWQVPLKVDLYAVGNHTTPAFSYDVTTDQNGIFTITNIPAGTYTLAVKNLQTLKRVLTAQVLVEGSNNKSFGILLGGDANNNNTVSLADLSILLNTFNKASGAPGYDSRADLNGDGVVSLSDLSILNSNLNKAGETP